MTTLSFNDIEFDVIDNVLAKRYSKFLMENINQSKEFYFMGDKMDEMAAHRRRWREGQPLLPWHSS